jgi:hypothetical protein
MYRVRAKFSRYISFEAVARVSVVLGQLSGSAE